MSDDLMLKCLICFILGWLASRMIGNGFRVGSIIGAPGSACGFFPDVFGGCGPPKT